MKSFRVVVCFSVVLVLLGFLVGQALAELPQIREIKDKIRWGDPDCPWSRERGAKDMRIGDPEQGIPDSGEKVAVSIGIGPMRMKLGLMPELPWLEGPKTVGRIQVAPHMVSRLSSAPKQ
jgi:hypothetical protein